MLAVQGRVALRDLRSEACETRLDASAGVGPADVSSAGSQRPASHRRSTPQGGRRAAAGGARSSSALPLPLDKPAVTSMPRRRDSQEFREELRGMPRGPGGSLRPLSGIAQFLYDAAKPSPDRQSPMLKRRGILDGVRGRLDKILGSLKVRLRRDAGRAPGFVRRPGGRGIARIPPCRAYLDSPRG